MSEALAAACLASELPHAVALGKEKWTIYLLDAVTFRAYMRSPLDQEIYIAQFACDGYREKPPLIEFLDPVDGQPGTQRAYPKSSDSWFHNLPCVCKPFSRKAYSAHGGPHQDWTFPDWVRNAANHNTIGDMLLGIYSRIADSHWYQGPMQSRPR